MAPPIHRQSSLQRRRHVAKQKKVTRRTRAHFRDLIKYPLFSVWSLALCFVPLLSLLTSPQKSPERLGLSGGITLFIFILILNGVRRMQQGRSPFVKGWEGVCLSVLLFFWIGIDFVELSLYAPMITFKIGVSTILFAVKMITRERHLVIKPHQESLFKSTRLMRDILGITVGLITLFLWRFELQLTRYHYLLLLLCQSAYTALVYFTFKKRNAVVQTQSFWPKSVTIILAMILPLISTYSYTLGNHYGTSLAPFLGSLLLIFHALNQGDHSLLKIRSWERSVISPWRALSATIFSLCMIGTAVLSLPYVTLNGKGLTFIEAAFTSVSASCITGLSIIDLSQLNGLGQAITLCLIQIGGFGIILLTHMLLSVATSRYVSGFKHLAHEAMGGHFSLQSEAQKLFVFVLFVESISGLILTSLFIMSGYLPFDALWMGIFTSISAFCNAGFALQSDSFVSFADQPAVLLVIAITVILGGIGPRVVTELLDRGRCWLKGKRSPRLSLYSRTILWSSLVLLILPTMIFAWREWGGALSSLQAGDKVINAFFHSTSLRTAGFNSFDLAQLSDESWSLSMLLMIIGGSPFSTAGGIKITTFALLVTSILPVLRGDHGTVIFERSQPLIQSTKAMAILVLSLLIILGMTFILQIAGEPLELKALLFEVVSALGTVGLSVGGTSQLSSFGLCTIMVCMFLGRVGPPALLLSITQTPSETSSAFVEEELPL